MAKVSMIGGNVWKQKPRRVLEQREYGRDVLEYSFGVSLKLRIILPSYLLKRNQNMSTQLGDMHTTLLAAL